MHRNSLEDATARALDLLPHDDAARSDPRLVRDAKCVEEIRATQEAAADVWLATSPLCAAPPDVLSSIMSKVDARTPLAHRHVKFFPWLAASGWVAAAIAFLLWPRDGERASVVARVDRPVFIPQQARSEAVAAPAEPAAPAGRHVIPEDRRLLEKLQRYQARFDPLDEDSALTAPRVLALQSPNALLRSPEEMQRRLVTAFENAVGWAMAEDGGLSGDPARMVLKVGWIPEGMVLAEGEYIRHLNFPPNAAALYGLLVSKDGAYYDEANDMIWSRDEEGRGFLGRRVTSEDNLHAFDLPDEQALAANVQAVSAEAEGYLIEDRTSNSAKVLIDQVRPPAPGFEQVVVWTNAAGDEVRIPVENPAVAPLQEAPLAAAPLTVSPLPSVTTQTLVAPAEVRIPVLPSMAQAGTSRLFFSLPDSSAVTSFSLIEQPIAGTSVAGSVVAPKVIVSGSRGSKLR